MTRRWLSSGLLTAAVVALLLLGCAQTQFEVAQGEVVRKMSWLNAANPERDFQSALDRKDYRFFGLHGYTLVVPKVSRNCISIDTDVIAIEGTSDVVLGYEHAKLIAIAATYADDFNFRMRLFREKNFGFKCES